MRCGCWLLDFCFVIVLTDGLRLSEKTDPSSGETPTLFCFSWTPQRKKEISVLPEVKNQLSQCDGHMFFTDEDAPGIDDTIVRVHVPKQAQSRGDENWLLAHNMAGLIPSWSHLLENNVVNNYDWVMNSELDHFVRPSQVRNWLVATQDHLTTTEDNFRQEQPLMMGWGNAYLFNRAMVSQMREQWQVLSKTIDIDIETEKDKKLISANGCPDWLDGKPFWPGCAQDIAYGIMATAIMDPPVQLASAHAPFPESCHVPLVSMHDLTRPGHDDSGWNQEDWQLEAIRHFHSGSSNTSKFFRVGLRDNTQSHRYARIEESLRLLQAYEDFDENFRETSATKVSKIKSFLHKMIQQESSRFLDWDLCPEGPSKAIPLLHSVYYVSVHRLSRQLLGL